MIINIYYPIIGNGNINSYEHHKRDIQPGEHLIKNIFIFSVYLVRTKVFYIFFGCFFFAYKTKRFFFFYYFLFLLKFITLLLNTSQWLIAYSIPWAS